MARFDPQPNHSDQVAAEDEFAVTSEQLALALDPATPLVSAAEPAWRYKPELARFVNDQLARLAGR
ncbi:MAG: hypothetical protein LC777_20795 [Actinobacteria bacterium]|nr:hypothetical protein [Actinomycetota bacterium]